MSQDVFSMIMEMNRANMQLQLVLQCAPTIAGLKPSNLCTIPAEGERWLEAEAKEAGLGFYRLYRSDSKTVYLVYHRKALENYLSQPEIRQYFQGLKYEGQTLGYDLQKFQLRYESYRNCGGQFPHEMGLLLGYPLADVKGFIENEGKNALLSGYWKVYENPAACRELFRKFDAEKERQIRWVVKGVTLQQVRNYYERRNCQMIAG